GLVRLLRDVGLAEDIVQDALTTALETGPTGGVPSNPGAWLMTTAKRPAVDLLRPRKNVERRQEAIGRTLDEENVTPDLERVLDDDVGDDVLRLVFIACHPLLSPEARVALTLRLVLGLTTEEIARAFLVPEPTIQQRIVRAKK